MTVEEAQRLIAKCRNAMVNGSITRADQADLKLLDRFCAYLQALIPRAVLPKDAGMVGKIASAQEVLLRIKEPDLERVGS